MKKITFAVFAVIILTVCLFAGCNGAEGGKITDTQQNLSEAMTGAQEMITNVSEAFTDATDTQTVPESVTAASSALDTASSSAR